MDTHPTPLAPGQPSSQPSSSPSSSPTEAPAPASEAAPLDLDAVTADLVGVEAALERLDEGTYGRCLACDAPIDDAALEASPTQSTCAAHLPV